MKPIYHKILLFVAVLAMIIMASMTGHAKEQSLELPALVGSPWAQVIDTQSNLIGWRSCATQTAFRSDWKVTITFAEPPKPAPVKSQIEVAGAVTATVQLENKNSAQRSIDIMADAQLSVLIGGVTSNVTNPQRLRFDLAANDGETDYGGPAGGSKTATAKLSRMFDTGVAQITVEALDQTDLSGTTNMAINTDAFQDATVCKTVWYQPTGEIGNYFWFDEDYDGAQGAGEPPVKGAKLTLAKDGKPVRTTVTDGNGKYSFPNLLPGEYCVLVDEAPDFPGTGANRAADDLDSDLIGLELGCANINEDKNLTLDGGLAPETGLNVLKLAPDTVNEGEPFTTTISVENTGKYTATGVVIRDVVPVEYALISDRSVWEIGNIAPGETKSVSVTLVARGVRNHESIQNTAIVETATKKSGGNNIAVADTTFISSDSQCFLPIAAKPGTPEPAPASPCEKSYIKAVMHYPIITDREITGEYTRTVTFTVGAGTIQAIPHPSYIEGYDVEFEYVGPGVATWYRYGNLGEYESYQGNRYTWVTNRLLASLFRGLYVETPCGYVLILWGVDPL